MCWKACVVRNRSRRFAGARGIAESLYYNGSKEFLEAGKKRLAGDTARAATSDEVKVLRKEARDLKEVVAEQALGPLKKDDVVLCFSRIVGMEHSDRLSFLR